MIINKRFMVYRYYFVTCFVLLESFLLQIFYLFEVFVFGEVDAVEGLLAEEGLTDIGFDEGGDEMPLGVETGFVDGDTSLLAEGDNLLDEFVGRGETATEEV